MKINPSRKKTFDYQLVKELSLTMDNEREVFNQEGRLAKSYSQRWNKGNFNFAKAQTGVKNLIVVPYAKKYKQEWGVPVSKDVRDAVTRNRMRVILKRMQGKD